jgi:hypothetical protein
MSPADTHINGQGADVRGGLDWKFVIMGALSGKTARRIFTAAEFHEFVQAVRPQASTSTARTVAEMLVSANALRRVSSGIFLNLRSTPPAELTEVAAHIRAGAVISLHSVLGGVGFLNNPSAIVTAVLPTSTSKRPRLGEVRTSTGATFRFYGLAEKFFPATEADRFLMLAPGRPCDTFRPEAALLQWLHLSAMQRSSMTPLSTQVDMEELDQELLGELAVRWGLGRALNDWRARAEAANFGEEPEPAASAPAGPVGQDAMDRSAAARERLMARRKPAE